MIVQRPSEGKRPRPAQGISRDCPFGVTRRLRPAALLFCGRKTTSPPLPPALLKSSVDEELAAVVIRSLIAVYGTAAGSISNHVPSPPPRKSSRTAPSVAGRAPTLIRSLPE